MAGFAAGLEAHATFIANLNYACINAAPHGITILIEPLNKYDAPGYFLTTTDQAVFIINEVGAKNLKLMFDCYHVQLMEVILHTVWSKTYHISGIFSLLRCLTVGHQITVKLTIIICFKLLQALDMTPLSVRSTSR